MSFEISNVFELNTACSKNQLYKRGRSGRTYLNPLAKPAYEEISEWIASQPIQIFQGKIHIEAILYKHRAKLDAPNFVDWLSDSLKGPLGVDDQWFSISIDWAMAPMNDAPTIAIKITQEINEHYDWCRSCHDVVPQRGMQSNKCIPCLMAKRGK